MEFIIHKGFDILGAIAILLAAALVAHWLGKRLEGWLGKQKMDLPVRTLVVRVVKLLVFLLAGVLVLEKLGVAIAPMVAGIGVAGAGIALAMQGVLSNLVAGLQIIFVKRFRVGEFIEIVGETGQVANVELFSTVLVLADGSHVVIPNKKIIGEILHNYGTMRQLNLTVGVAYGSNMDLVLATIHEVVNANPRVLKTPAPTVIVSSLGDSSINISVFLWTALQDYGTAQHEVHLAVLERFREKGIEMPFPQREIRLLNAPAGAAGAA
ncbi:MAG: mechanosensitive ion channel family protein [Verrucomicrobia bacterium]|nr:mechanosensitive ion channel family protein [Verrucomicrobiota bacterium]